MTKKINAGGDRCPQSPAGTYPPQVPFFKSSMWPYRDSNARSTNFNTLFHCTNYSAGSRCYSFFHGEIQWK